MADFTPVPPEKAKDYNFGPRNSNPLAGKYNDSIREIVGKGPHVIEVTPETKQQHVTALYQAARINKLKVNVKSDKENVNRIVVNATNPD